MTGFGSGEAQKGELAISCEIRTLNHRGLDVKVKLPRELVALEGDVIEFIRRQFVRGRIDITFHVSSSAILSRQAKIDTVALQQVLSTLERFSKTSSLVTPEIRLGDVFNLRDVFCFEESSDIAVEAKPLLVQAMQNALISVVKARQHEGKSLQASIKKLLVDCKKSVVQLSSLMSNAPVIHMKEMRERLVKLLDGKAVDEARLTQEIAIIADKTDITEELERLNAHFSHFATIGESEEASGRKLDFMCQEMFREANTIGSKCQDAVAQHIVVELKSNIERIRELVQNIE